MQPNRKNYARTYIEHKQLLHDLVSTVTALFAETAEVGASSNGSLYPETVSNAGALLCVHSSIEQIFLNEFRIMKPDGSPDLWRFFEGLKWLNPSMTDSVTQSSPHIHIPYARIRKDKALAWLYESLESHQLSQKLNLLLSDVEHLYNCYEVTSFLRARAFSDALFICLNAIERNQLQLLSQIDKSLIRPSEEHSPQGHRRASSHPDFQLVKPRITPDLFQQKNRDSCDGSKSAQNKKQDKSTGKKKRRRKLSSNLKNRPWRSLPNLHSSNSIIGRPPRNRCQTISSQPIQIPRKRPRLTSETLASLSGSSNIDRKVPSFSYSTKPNQIPSDSGSSCAVTPIQPITLVKCDDIEIHLDCKFTPQKEAKTTLLPPPDIEGNVAAELIKSSVDNAIKTANSTGSSSFSPRSMDFLSCIPSPRNLLPLFSEKSPTTSKAEKATLGSVPNEFVNTFGPQEGEKIKNRYRTISEDGGFDLNSFENFQENRVVPSRPVLGQSLTSYLQAAQFSRANTELERENAHFSICEAMIAAVEQIKWRKQEKEFLKMQRKQREDIRTRELMRRGGDCIWERKKFRRLKKWSSETTADPVTDSSDEDIETSFETSNDATRDQSSNGSSSFLAASDLNTSSDSRDNDEYLEGLSVSTQNINDHQAYAEWGEINTQTLSAESVALSLIAKFSDKQLPRASDLIWLVSEQDAPQKMLPMPDSWSVSPDDVYPVTTFTRGTRDWAPPRRQIIFTRHPPPNRKRVLYQQNMRCAGCGMKVAVAYSNIFRYCDYLGKYFCTGCHRNQISTIPSRILDNWDFSMHPVSVFSYRLLDQISTYALFRVGDVAPQLYKKVRMLRAARFRRTQLKYIQDFIMTCRFAIEVQEIFTKISHYITTDLDLWSMSDFLAIKNGNFQKNIGSLIDECERHIYACELCMARGFICERCTRKSIIFPWQTKVRRCPDCGCCAHDNCWKATDKECSKCLRIKNRLQI